MSEEHNLELFEFCLKFYELGYQMAINSLITAKPLVESTKKEAMREYFLIKAREKGLIDDTKS